MSRPLLCAVTALLIANAPASAQSTCPFGSPLRGAIAWQFGLTPRTVSGVVLRVGTGLPLGDARVDLRPVSDTLLTTLALRYDDGRVVNASAAPFAVSHTTRTDSLGRFAMTAVPAGQYRIRVMSMHVRGVSDTVTVGGAGLRVVAALAEWRDQHDCVGEPIDPPGVG